jgi:hypothetical protein
MSEFIDLNAPSLQGKMPKLPEDLPHGLLVPPPEVLELIEKERPKHRPEAFAKAYESLLNEWTIGYYFDYLGHEVLYRPTPQGPEVLAVGEEEVIRLKKTWPLEEQRQIQTFLGY